MEEATEALAAGVSSPAKGKKRGRPPLGDQSHSPAPAKKRRKLLEGEKVEIRFTEDGLKGSWHPASVVGCGDCIRHVEYNEILADDNMSKLVEAIPVPKAVEGAAPRLPRDHRCSVRPEPPRQSVDQFSLSYGTCVDALLDDAWWEGVIFDRDDGEPQRWVLFPDQGDRHLIPVHRMRPTLDWSELTGNWKPRGQWTMLKVLDRLEKEEPFPISVREIWYDVSSSDAFQQRIRHWVSGTWFAWRSLVTNVIKEALAVAQGGTFAEVVPLTQSPWEEEHPLALEHAGGAASPKCVPVLGDSSHLPIEMPADWDNSVPDLVGGSLPPRSSTKLCSIAEDGVSSHDSENAVNPLSVNEPILKGGSKSAVLAFINDRRNCARTPESRKKFRELFKAAEKELLSAGWTVEKCQDSHRKRYFSSEGHRPPSFIKACEIWAKGNSIQETKCDRRNSKRHKTTNGDNCAGTTTTGKEMANWELTNIRAELSTFAILDYVNYLKEVKSQSERPGQSGFLLESTKKAAKKHLVALGWGVYRQKAEFAGRTIYKHLYVALDGTQFRTLDKAIMHLIKTGQYATGEEKDLDETNLGPAGVSSKESVVPSKTVISRREVLVPESCPEALQEERDLDEINLGSAGVNCEELVVPSKAVTPRGEVLVPESCPEALRDYVECMELRKNGAVTNEDVLQKRSRARKHIFHLGWKGWYIKKWGRVEMRYTSPEQTVFPNLLHVCNYLLGRQGSSKRIYRKQGANKLDCNNLKFRIRSMPSIKPCKAKKASGGASGKCTTSLSDIPHFKEVSVITSSRRKKRLGSRRTTDDSVSSGCRDVIEGPSSSGYCESHKKSRKRKISCTAGGKHRSRSSTAIPRTRLQSKSDGQVLEFLQLAPKTVLSWITDKNVVSLRQKVQYLCKIDGHVMKEGQIIREGIRCKCCKKVFTLSQFEIHAGSTSQSPSANIFLLDGRSLLDCQRQALKSDESTKSMAKHVKSDKLLYPYDNDRSHKRIKIDLSHCQSDGICSICQDGGTLILCDYCPSSYHLSCIGLEDVPEGKWFCPPCRCGICGLGEFNCNSTQFTDETKLFCDQCEREYHVGCLEKCGSGAITSCPKGYWYCGNACSKISSQLHHLLGVSNATNVEGYSWTILKSDNDKFDNEAFTNETVIEHQSKLCVALDVLHECFVKMIEPRTNRDLVTDLLFNKESELNRLNFWGFYTLLLEKDEELITVATVRIVGNKAAEMPLIGTRIKYRRQGMCRLLINELEKLLCSLGVEKLLLPAIPDLLETWKTKFGFSEMHDSDQLLLAEHTFLGFQGTVMCQKSICSSTTDISDSVQVLEKRKFDGGESSGVTIDTRRNRSSSNNDVSTAEVETVPPLNATPSIPCLLPSEGVLVGEGCTLLVKVHDSATSLQSTGALAR